MVKNSFKPEIYKDLYEVEIQEDQAASPKTQKQPRCERQVASDVGKQESTEPTGPPREKQTASTLKEPEAATYNVREMLSAKLQENFADQQSFYFAAKIIRLKKNDFIRSSKFTCIPFRCHALL